SCAAETSGDRDRDRLSVGALAVSAVRGLYTAFTSRSLLFTFSLQVAPYVAPMQFVPQRDDRHDRAAGQPLPNEGTRMSVWRWLLFIAMSRFEMSEERYFRIPNAKTIRRDVPVRPKPTSEPTGSPIE